MALAKSVKSTDAGFLFQDEVTREIVVDLKDDRPELTNPFDDLGGRFKPSSTEYQALLIAAGIASDIGFPADQNVKVNSLKILRQKFDAEMKRLASKTSADGAGGSAQEVADVAMGAAIAASIATSIGNEHFNEPVESNTPARVSTQRFDFSVVIESGFADPILGGYRLIPLERGLLLANESGEKRVFSNREVSKDDTFKVAIGKSETGESVLAVLHQARQVQSEDVQKLTVWVLALTITESEKNRIVWTKSFEFDVPYVDRGVASPSESPYLTLSGETVSVSIAGTSKAMAVKTGEPTEFKPGP